MARTHILRATLAAAGIALAALSLPGAGIAADHRTVGATVPTATGFGSFTPAAADPRLAALLIRSGVVTGGFRFTPASVSVRLNRSVTVAVRARSSAPSRSLALTTPASSAIAPIAYSLGVAVGWRHFSLSSDVDHVDTGLTGGREAMDVGVGYNGRKWSTRLAVGADRPTPASPRSLAGGAGYSLDLAGSYSISRRVDLTAGVRYRMAERDRLAPLADGRGDSQAVYVGTAFKF